MSERDPDKHMLIDAMKQMAEAGIDPDQPFTERVFAPIAKEYGIASENVYIARLMLNTACVDVIFELARTAYLTPHVRKRLREVRKHARVLDRALGDLEIEDQYAICQAEMANKLRNTSLGKLDNIEVLSGSNLLRLLPDALNQMLGEHVETLDLIAALRLDLTKIEHAFSQSLRMVGEGKKGRYRDEHLDSLFRMAFQVLENFTEHRFTLQWHDDGQPISVAARFCTAVAEVVAPEAPLSLIQTLSRQVRETSLKVSDLDEVSEYLKHFSKRSR